MHISRPFYLTVFFSVQENITIKDGCIRFEFSKPSGVLRRALELKANAKNLGNLSLFLLANLTTRKAYKSKMKLIQ